MAGEVLNDWRRIVFRSSGTAALYAPDGKVIDRKAIDDESDRICREWTEAGLRARRIIALNLSNGLSWMSGFLACLKLGSVAVPLDPGFSSEESFGLARELKAQAIWDGSVLRTGLVARPRVFRNDDIEVGKLTSGSTGSPKKLFFTGAEMIADSRRLIACMGIRPTDVNLGLIPWGHSYGLGSIVYPLLGQGTATAWTETPFPSEIGTVCERVGCTLFPSVPTVLKALSRSDIPPESFRTLRLVVSAGARLAPEIARAFLDRFGKRVHNFYGSTETGGISFDKTGEAALSGRSVGKPIEGVRIVPGRGDRFFVESDAVFSFGNRRRSDRGVPMAMVADHGGIDAEGELRLKRRAVNLMKIGARRINPLDVERRLIAIERISDAKVFALERDGDSVIAAAVESDMEQSELGPLLKRRMPLRLRPKRCRIYSSLPVSARGKVSLAAIYRDFANADESDR